MLGSVGMGAGLLPPNTDPCPVEPLLLPKGGQFQCSRQREVPLPIQLIPQGCMGTADRRDSDLSLSLSHILAPG